MNSTEQALADALDAAAETVRQGTLRPLPSVAGKGRPRTKGSRRGWLMPMTAAIAVALVAALTVTLAGFGHSTSSGPASPSPAPARPARPSYFAESTGKILQVRSAVTGKLIGEVTLPELASGEVWGITAAPDGRTFYVVQNPAGQRSVQQPWIYSFQVTGNGRVTPLRYIARGPAGGPGDVMNPYIAISPDGTELALTMHTVRNYFNETDTIVVVNLRTGTYHLWRGGLTRTVRGISLNIWDLSWSSASTLDFVASWCSNVQWLYCGSGSAQVRALSVGAHGGSLAGSTELVDLARFPDATEMVADQQGHLTIMQVSGRDQPRARPGVTIDQVAAAGGAVLHVLYRHSYPAEQQVYVWSMISDPSGQYLMVWVVPNASGWLHDGALHPVPGYRSSILGGGFAW